MKAICLSYAILNFVLAGCAQAALVDQPNRLQQEPVVSEYFDSCVDLDYSPLQGGWTVTVNGEPVPTSFKVDHLFDPWRELKLDPPLEFVLVIPQAVSLKNDPLPAPQPFYVARTVISNLDMAVIAKQSRGGYNEEGYREWWIATLRELELWDDEAGGPSTRRPSHVEVAELLRDPRLPARNGTMDLVNAMEIAGEVSRGTRTLTRLPTIAEWLSVLSAGTGNRFWWGDDWDPKRRMGGDGEAPPAPSRERLRQVHIPHGDHPLGVQNLIGNVREVVYPTSEERDILRRAIRQSATLPEDMLHESSAIRWRAFGYGLVASHSGMLMGLSVDVRSSVGAEGFFCPLLISRHQLIKNRADHYAGVRLVMELPPGEVRILKPLEAEAPGDGL
jgi:hypothetical protein